MRRIVWGVLLVSGSVFAAPAAPVNLRVMSFNVQHGNSGVTTLATFMAAQGADVIGLQEVHSHQTAAFESEMERLTGQAWHAVWAPVGGTSTEGNLLLSRIPYVSSEYREIGPSSWGGNRTAARGEIRVNGVSIHIFNTHLDWVSGSTTNRTINLTQLLSWQESFPAPKMLIGDFNSNYYEYWITEIKKTYTDTYEDVTGNPAGPATHQNGWRPDYIFRSKAQASAFVPTACWVVQTTLSDHRPILTDFRIDSVGRAPYGGAPAALPGTVQAENFDLGGPGVAYQDTTAGNNGGQHRPTEDVDIEATSDTGGGFNLGWVKAGEWLEYTVDVAAAGTYTIEARVSCNGGGGAFHIAFNGVNKTGTLTVPNTAGWQSWTTVSQSGVPLSSGVQVLRISMDAVGTSGSVGNFNYVRIVATGSGQSPYLGVPAALPGTVEAENFDLGGQNIASYDVDPGNTGGVYRAAEAVDIQTTTDTGGGYNVGWIAAGEWLEYTVDVAAAGTYTIEARVACNGGGGAFHIEFNGVDKTGTLTIPNTAGWQSWTTVSRPGVPLSSGVQVLRISMDAVGTSGTVGNLNYVRIVAAGSGQSPYGGTPAALPGIVQAEDFDLGGQNVAYVDLDPANQGGAYRGTEAVDLEPCADAGAGFNVGWIKAGEWLEYAVNVAATGTYTVEVRVASNGPGGTFHVEFNGVNKTGTLTIPNTAGWQSWTTLSVPGVPLSAGVQILRVVMDTNGAGGSVGNVNYVAVSGPGLKGEYFSDTTLTTLAASRIDPVINFDWGLGAPHPAVGADNFSVRWTGQVVPRYTETYTFTTRSDDGVRLWVNGVLLVDNWTYHAVVENSGMIALTAGQRYDLRMEFFKGLYDAVATLSWSSPSQVKEIIPESRLSPPPSAMVLSVSASRPGPTGGEGGACGATGMEAVIALILLGLRRRSAT